jgi:hypothetical protein
MMSPADPIHCGIVDTSLLQTLCLVSQQTHWCLVEGLYIVTQGTMMSPADPTHCGTGDNDVSCRPYTLWHGGHWSLLQTLCRTPHYFDMYSCRCQISASYKCLLLFLVTALLTGNFDNSQQYHKHLEMVVWGTQHKKKSHDGSHCVKWNNILLTEFSELFTASRMYKNI